MRAQDGLWQKTDAKAREHHLHRHGRIVAVAGHIRRKAAALALLHQKVVVAPQVVRAQQAHRHTLEPLDGHLVQFWRGVQVLAHDELELILAQNAFLQAARLARGGAQEQRMQLAAVERFNELLRRAHTDEELHLRIAAVIFIYIM